jgi:DNA mismatch endonuclease (patch repair protein)
MRRVKSKNTSPELALRRLVRQLGFSGYRVHRQNLPGKPDLAWGVRKQAIFLHGCFWHGHDCLRGARMPKSNTSYWQAKIEGNRQRDARHLAELEEMGWRTLVVWECELKNEEALIAKTKAFLA